MLNTNKIHCDACEAVIQAIDRCSNEFKRSGVKNIEWNLLAIRKIDVEGLSERWLKIVRGNCVDLKKTHYGDCMDIMKDIDSISLEYLQN
jgi:hypothetical protein